MIHKIQRPDDYNTVLLLFLQVLGMTRKNADEFTLVHKPRMHSPLDRYVFRNHKLIGTATVNEGYTQLETIPYVKIIREFMGHENKVLEVPYNDPVINVKVLKALCSRCARTGEPQSFMHWSVEILR